MVLVLCSVASPYAGATARMLSDRNGLDGGDIETTHEVVVRVSNQPVKKQTENRSITSFNQHNS
jgi:hypothetical protein